MRGDAGAGVAAAGTLADVEGPASGLEVEGADVAAAAIEDKRGFAAPLGVDPRGGVSLAGVEDPKPGLTRCYEEDRERNMLSICGLSIWPKGVARNSAGSPVAYELSSTGKRRTGR